MSEIKPCPFCGSDEINIRAKSFTDGSFQTWIECASCLAHTQRTNDLDAAIEAWNTQAKKACKRVWTGAEMICSECAFQLNNATWNYCPNCGAKIIGGNE